jgi:hypothetical protein
MYLPDFDSQSVETPMATLIGMHGVNCFNDAELSLLEGVFAYRGIHAHPTEDQFKQGLAVMSACVKQVQDNPLEEGSEADAETRVGRLLPALSSISPAVQACADPLLRKSDAKVAALRMLCISIA